MLLLSVVPDEVADLASRDADVGQEPVIQSLELAFRAGAPHIADHAARDPAEKLRHKAQRETMMRAAPVDRGAGHDDSPITARTLLARPTRSVRHGSDLRCTIYMAWAERCARGAQAIHLCSSCISPFTRC